MTFASLMGLGLLSGAPLRVLGLVALAYSKPALMGILLAAGAGVGMFQARGTDTETTILTAIAVELRAGQSLRGALIAVASDAGGKFVLLERLVRVGLPLQLSAGELEAQLPSQGRLAGAAVRLVGLAGGQAATVFESLAVLAQDDQELRREAVTASAAIRFSAWIIGGIPVLMVVWQLASGRMAATLQLPFGIPIVGVGLLLVAVGASVVAVMTRKALR
jgi:Flp pilus assembly protein TadB